MGRHTRRRRSAVPWLSLLLTLAWSGGTGSEARQPEPFRLDEATIADIHAALERDALTCRELVIGYLARIEAYDDAGPRLNALITVNPDARAEADRRDARRATRPDRLGSLHCVPVILKDNYDTFDLPTTGGGGHPGRLGPAR